MGRLLTAARIACGLVVASSFVLPGIAANAQSAPDDEPADTTTPTAPAAPLGGFTGSAAASGVHVKYNPEGLLPIGAPVDIGIPDALATIASGPSTFARASVADPGDLIANPGAVLGLLQPNFPSGVIPAYPFRITASSGVGQPTAESNPAPGLHARVDVTPTGSTASATTPAIDAPGVVTVGSLSSSATTETDGTSVTVHARNEIGVVDILGLIHIDALVTDVTATSNGGDTELSGGTTVVGGTILGQPFTVDDQGLRAFLGPLDLAQLLSKLGITITVPGPVELDGQTAGQLAATALRIDIVASADTLGLTQLLDSLPPLPALIPGVPSIEDLLAVARARHVLSIELGRGVVSLTARSAAPRPTTTPTTSGSGSSGSTGSPSTGGTGTGTRTTTPITTGGTTQQAGPSVAPPAAPEAVSPSPIASVDTGVGALALLLLLIAPFIGERLARMAALQLAIDQEGCPNGSHDDGAG